MPHPDWIHYFTLFMWFVFIPGTILAGLASIAWNARATLRDTRGRCRRERLRRQFRAEFIAWKRAERIHDGSALIHFVSASFTAAALRNLDA